MRPDSPQLLAELRKGREALTRKDFDSALSIAESILAQSSGTIQAHLIKALSLLSVGRQLQAFESFNDVLLLEPANVDALSWCGIVSLNLGKGSNAEAFGRRLQKAHPKNDRGIFLTASGLALQGRLVEALNEIDRALNLRPNEPDYLVAKAQILGRLDWSSQASEWFAKAMKARPTPNLAAEWATLLLQEGRLKEATELLERQLTISPGNVHLLQLLARAYTEAQQFDRAEKAWKMAISPLRPDIEGTILRIEAEIAAGRLSQAEDLILHALKHKERVGSLYSMLATIKKFSSGDEAVIESMESISSAASLSPEERKSLFYALGKAHNDLGDYGKAIAMYDLANKLAYEQNPVCSSFDPSAWKAFTDSHIAFFTRKRIDSLLHEGIQDRTPLFVVGMIRSGTTLTEHILSLHSQIADGGEKTFWPDHREEVFNSSNNRFDRVAANRLGRRFVEILRFHSENTSYIIEKNPSNVFLSAMLHCVYPRSKFVHIARNPADNAMSLWMTPLKTGLPFVHNRRNIVAAFGQYVRLRNHLQEVLTEETFKTFSYEDIVSNPQRTIEGMLEFIEVAPEPQCFHPEQNLRTVRTPSVYQVRQPINKSSLNRWKNYEPWLGDFKELLDLSS